jgi:PadR family transcriptional regulator PadR
MLLHLPYAVVKMASNETLGQFEQLILTSVLLLGENAYGATVHEKVEDLANGKSYSIGAIYTTLDRLEQKGYVKSWYGGSTNERGGRTKRYFEIQAAGQRALREARSVAANMLTALDAVGGGA